MLKKRKLTKILSLCLISSFFLGMTQGVDAGKEGDQPTSEATAPTVTTPPTQEATPPTPPEATPETHEEHHDRTTSQPIAIPVSSVAVSTLSLLGLPKLALVAGGVIAIAEINTEASKVKDYVFHPLVNFFKRNYAKGINPFRDPGEIRDGILKVCSDYHMSPENTLILRNFAGPIIAQLMDAQYHNDRVLPANFQFNPGTVRCLYLIGEPGSGKSSLALDALPKVFLRKPKDLMLVQPGSVATGEDVVQVLFSPHACFEGQYQKTAVPVEQSKTLTEEISCRFGRGIVACDDYLKYRSTSFDLCVFNLHDQGKIITKVGAIDCPALLMFFTSNESKSEFMSIERQVTKKAKAVDLKDVSGQELTVTNDDITREVGHPEGFDRRVFVMEFSRLSGRYLKEALKRRFYETCAPVISCGHKLHLSKGALEQLTKSNTNNDNGRSHAFDFSKIETAVSDFILDHRNLPAESSLEIVPSGDGDDQFRVISPQVPVVESRVDLETVAPGSENDDFEIQLEEGTNEDLPTPAVSRRGNCISRFITRYGLRETAAKIKSAFFCCCHDPENDEESALLQLPSYYQQHQQQEDSDESISELSSGEESEKVQSAPTEEETAEETSPQNEPLQANSQAEEDQHNQPSKSSTDSNQDEQSSKACDPQ